MGIKKFSDFIQRMFDAANSDKSPQTKIKLKPGDTLAIDFMNFAYMYYNGKGRSSKNRLMGVINEIINFMYILHSYASINSIVVFDGFVSQTTTVFCSKCGEDVEHTMEKDEFLKANDIRCPTCNKRCKPLFNFNKNRSASATVIHVSKEDARQCSKFLIKHGFPVVFANTEGERGACKLVKDGHAKAVYTKDTDTIGMGVIQVNQVDIDYTSREIKFYGYNPEFLERVCLLKPRYLRYAGCLLGNDINENEKGVGPAAITQIMAEVVSKNLRSKEIESMEAYEFFKPSSEIVRIIRTSMDTSMLASKIVKMDRPTVALKYFAALVPESDASCNWEYFNGEIWKGIDPEKEHRIENNTYKDCPVRRKS